MGVGLINSSACYEEQRSWKLLQKYLPEANQIKSDYSPVEEFWSWRQHRIHIDHYYSPSSRIKVVLLHGVGGNGRLLSFIGVPLSKQGMEVIAPDLPGYGYSLIKNDTINYHMWIELVDDLVNYELEKDERPVVLFGLSAGGMLAYHAGCKNEKVSGIIVTNLLDQRDIEVRDASASSKAMSRLGAVLVNMFNILLPKARIPMKFVANMKAIVNDKRILDILLNDDTAAGTSVSIRFIHSLINAAPVIEPEEFTYCPLLLLHPEKDNWTALNVSKSFFDRLKCAKEIKILENAGHFPVEQPGLKQLEEYSLSFLGNIQEVIQLKRT